MNDNKDLKYHSDNSNNEYNNYNNGDENFIMEECYYCKIHMEDINEIFVDLENDVYICKECGVRHRVKIVRCKGLE